LATHRQERNTNDVITPLPEPVPSHEPHSSAACSDAAARRALFQIGRLNPSWLGGLRRGRFARCQQVSVAEESWLVRSWRDGAA
jgi:hypothetical protein